MATSSGNCCSALCPLGSEHLPPFTLLSHSVSDEFVDGSLLHYPDPSHVHNLTRRLRQETTHIATNTISNSVLNTLI